MNKHIKATIKAVKEQEGVITGAIASSESVDRDGDVLVASGWQLEKYKSNPVLLWSHNPFIPPIGKVTNIAVEGTQLKFDAQFAIEENELAKQVFDLMKGGYINTFSVGYIPIAQDADGKTTSMELLEISAVAIPANPDAQVTRQFQNMQALATKMAKEHEADQTKDEPVVEEKVGRVISEKNKSLIEVAIEGMTQATGALKTLLKDANGDDAKGGRPPIYPKVEAPKPPAAKGANREVRRALVLADKALDHAFHTINSQKIHTGLKGGEMKK